MASPPLSPACMIVGAPGATGATGATGAGGSGSVGPTGPTGPTGSQGNPGSNGVTGATGATGNQGVTGTTGSSGSNGAAGTTGGTGATGSSGVAGAHVRKSSGQTQGTSTADVSSLVLALGVGTYRFEFDCIYQTNGVLAGMQFALSFSGTASAVSYAVQQFTALGTITTGVAAALDTLLGGSGVGPGTTDVPARVAGTIVVTGAGNLQLRMRATGVAATATIQAGSSAGAFQVV